MIYSFVRRLYYNDFAVCRVMFVYFYTAYTYTDYGYQRVCVCVGDVYALVCVHVCVGGRRLQQVCICILISCVCMCVWTEYYRRGVAATAAGSLSRVQG